MFRGAEEEGKGKGKGFGTLPTGRQALMNADAW